MESFIKLGFPTEHLLKLPNGDAPLPDLHFTNPVLKSIFEGSMKVSTPLTIALVYFSFVHFVNPMIRKRQYNRAKQAGKIEPYEKLSKKQIKKLPAAPFTITKVYLFDVFVLLHNVFLCLYSVWTFLGMVSCIKDTILHIKGMSSVEDVGRVGYFFEAICEPNHGIFSSDVVKDNLEWFGYWFYLSKFYEVLDTIIILLKGRPSSLLQSYHHAGAMMCMWAGVRYKSPPIWIFVVFNSFIHSLMYFYFSLSCLKIRVPLIFKRSLTTMQIIQFIVGGSLACSHAFIWFTDLQTSTLSNCIGSPERALPLIINVVYLAPLTALFAIFYIESYLKRSSK